VSNTVDKGTTVAAVTFSTAYAKRYVRGKSCNKDTASVYIPRGVQ
jgi:hypothetical protein